MGTNLFSSMLDPLSDYLESIPIIGQILKLADKIALNTDPSQLSTAAVGKLIGGDFEDQYTSEEARKGASHSVGAAAISYLLGGGEAAAASGGEGAGGAGMAGGTEAGKLAAAQAGSASGTVGSAAAQSASAAQYGSLTAAELSAIAAEDAALSSSGVTAGSSAGIAPSGAAPYASSAETLSESLASKSLSNTELINYLIKAGNAISPKPESTSGSSVTSRTLSQQGLRSQDMDSIMGEALGPSESSAIFDKKGITLKDEDSALSRRFLSGSDSLIKPKTVKGRSDLAFKTSDEPTFNQAEVQEVRKSKGSGYSGMENVSLASPFYQPSV